MALLSGRGSTANSRPPRARRRSTKTSPSGERLAGGHAEPAHHPPHRRLAGSRPPTATCRRPCMATTKSCRITWTSVTSSSSSSGVSPLQELAAGLDNELVQVDAGIRAHRPDASASARSTCSVNAASASTPLASGRRSTSSPARSRSVEQRGGARGVRCDRLQDRTVRSRGRSHRCGPIGRRGALRRRLAAGERRRRSRRRRRRGRASARGAEGKGLRGGGIGPGATAPRQAGRGGSVDHRLARRTLGREPWAVAPSVPAPVVTAPAPACSASGRVTAHAAGRGPRSAPTHPGRAGK